MTEFKLAQNKREYALIMSMFALAASAAADCSEEQMTENVTAMLEEYRALPE